ncbi:MAG TPA: glycoside hydrolase family 2 TIM barrel-domain containing protein [Verrucomicrobiae bacterium]|nr:glycoside hydrolase family 2 TIM barrel-domain containing protein [Verrucomicrobiae bacterium]
MNPVSRAALVLILLGAFHLHAGVINLAGRWEFALDSKDEGVTSHWWTVPFGDHIQLPGTTAIAGKGEPLEIDLRLDRKNIGQLHPKFSHIGPAWYRRSVDLPESWQKKDVQLTLERVLWETRVWVNGTEIGRQDSLSTPHRHDITRTIRPGSNDIVIRVDNRKKIEIGGGHAYTPETQTIWNGMVGELKVEARDRLRIEHVALRPDVARGGVEVELKLHNGTGKTLSAELATEVVGRKFRARFEEIRERVTVPPGVSTTTRFHSLSPAFELWSEFNPRLYTLRATLSTCEFESKQERGFGMRAFKAEGRQLAVNGNPVFLRGTLECCIFPETAHPAMTDSKWETIFEAVKEHGLNHVRFHSWCPPEAAFRVADRMGVYLQVELPNWSFKMGELPAADEFFRQEGERMLREYGHHPSWVMFSMGNELLGDLEKLDALVAGLKPLDSTRLFTSTSYSWSADGAPRGLLPGPQDDFFISMKTQCGWVRGQGFFNDTKPNTTNDYAEGAACFDVPLVSHEAGQYNIYPDLRDLPKLNEGPLRATAWEAMKLDLEKKGRLEEAGRYVRDSGKLAAILYKEEIERALRTRHQAGIQLLDLHDFPGQGTATVGLLNAFWQSKGIISPHEFRRFAGATVPLARLPKRTFENTETLECAIEIAHFREMPIRNVLVEWTLRERSGRPRIFGGRLVGRGEFRVPEIPLGSGISLGNVQQPLSALEHAAKLTLEVRVRGTRIANDWSVWVYPSNASTAGVDDVRVCEAFDETLFAALADGEKVLLLPRRAALRTPVDAQFVPMFWSPTANPSKPGTLGATIDAAHPIWKNFPTSTHTDWQWWELLSSSFAIDLDGVVPRPVTPFAFVDKFNRNALPAGVFEVRVGTGQLLVCTLDITNDLDARIVARQLRKSILSYMNSRDFNPRTEWTPEILRTLARARATQQTWKSAPRGNETPWNAPRAERRAGGFFLYRFTFL